MRYGLVGQSLSHSFSKPIHERLADYSYELLPMEPEAFDDFLQKRDFSALNITIPYKQRVIPFCDVVDPRAERIGAVNTVVNRDGRLYGYNTDFDGFAWLLQKNGISLAGKTLLILGNGGTTRTIRAVAEAQGAKEVLIASRTAADGVLSYGEAARRSDVQVVANASPVGMYPSSGQSPISLDSFPALTGVADVVYNPLQTRLVQDGHALGLPSAGGLAMLVAQAKYACELFTGRTIGDEQIDIIHGEMLRKLANVVLIGMPGSGKTSLGRALAAELGLTYADTDDEVVRLAGKPIPDIFAAEGEAAFRNLEAEACATLGAQNGLVISTGGGAVLRAENLYSLRQNGILLFIHCPAEHLSLSGGRPLAKSRDDLLRLEAERLPLYRAAADAAIEREDGIEDATRQLATLYAQLLKA